MLDGSLIAMALLGAAALGLLAWQALAPSQRPPSRAVASLGLLLLAIAFAIMGIVALPLPLQAIGLSQSALAHLLGALLFGAAIIQALLHGEATAGDADPRLQHALRLLSLCGALLALLADDLLTMWVGLLLCLIATLAHEPRRVEALDTARFGGALTSLFGLALIYTALGTLDMDILERHLWTRASPTPAMFAIGVLLAALGVMLSTGLLPPAGHIAPPTTPLAMFLGIALLLRSYREPFGALGGSWAILLYGLGTLVILAGWLLSLRPSFDAKRLARLSLSQGGVLLYLLPLALQSTGLPILLLALLITTLSRMLIETALHTLPHDPDNEEGKAEATSARLSWQSISLLLSLLALAALPFTSRLADYVFSLWQAQNQQALLPLAPGLLALVLLAARYLLCCLDLLRQGRAPRAAPTLSLWTKAGLLLGLLALLFLSAYPAPLWALAQWAVGR